MGLGLSSSSREPEVGPVVTAIRDMKEAHDNQQVGEGPLPGGGGGGASSLLKGGGG